MQRCDVLFAARVLYIIDIRTQNFFRDAQQGIFTTSPLDFTGMFEDISQNRTFRARLPISITNESKKRKADSVSKQDQDDSGRRKPNSAWVKNEKINPAWKLRQGERFKTTFHENRDKCPTKQGIPICTKRQVLGGCFEGCHFNHDELNRGTPEYVAFDKYVADCRRGF